jgi:amino acid adenylation domain-containing protein
MYRTGDLARRRSDGNLECLGRVDFQVKIRGYRVELGEIETKLGAIDCVRDAVVIAREDVPGDKRLVGYVVVKEGLVLDVGALENELRRSLPEYMVPSAFVALDVLPLTTNGKVDRKALPAPDYGSGAAEYVAPRGAVEERLAEIFRDVLRLERVGIHDDFFALGGHSLRATQVAARLRATLSVEITVRAIFEAPNVAALAKVVRALTASAGLEPIVRVERGKPSPASFAQARLWFLDQMDPGSATYNVATAHRLEGTLDRAALERSLQALVARHEALRTTFVADAGELQQVIHPSFVLKLRAVAASSEDDARVQIAGEVHAPFDLARGPVLRATLVRLGPTTHVLVLCMHHIATDGWSMEVLFRELSALYRAFTAGAPSPLEPPRVDYVDFASWQRTGLGKGDTLEKQLAFWKAHLAGAPTALELPTDRPRPAMKQYRGGHVPFAVSAELADRLYALCRREGATPFMVLLAAYQALLSRWSGQSDIVVGTPIANRTRHELESIVGFFVNTLPLRTSFDGALVTFRELVNRVKRAALAAYAHQDVPFEKIVDELRIARDTSRTPVFQAMFVLQNTFEETRALGDLRVSVEPADIDVAKFDVTLVMSEREGKLLGVLEYDSTLFDGATAERFASHFLVLLEAAVAAPETTVAKLPLMSEAERARVLVEWNATSRPFDDAPVHEVLARRAAERPDAIAVACSDRQLTYGELNRQANRLARMLVRRGIGPGHAVATLFRRSEQMIVAQLAVLKAGAAYAPLDPSHPPARIAFFVADVGARLLLSTRDVASKVDVGLEIVALDEPAITAELAREQDDDLSRRCTPADTAYVIYTSGSTGQPKGSAIAHRNLANLVDHYRELLAIGPADRLSQIAAPAFDGTMNEIWPALITGATLDIADDDVRQSPTELARWIRARGVTIAYTATPMAELLLDEDWSRASLRALSTGGQALRRRPSGREPFRLVNIYGPTEATDYVTCEDVSPGTHPVTTIGRPIQNTAIYILDREDQPTPVGVYGELHIGGANVGRGYVGRPALTAERFVPDPFGPVIAGARLYRTGDRARWLADGRIEFGGRTDDQVKIRGYRIELGEIEVALTRIAGIERSVVLAREDVPGDKRLVAYVVAEGGTKPETKALETALAAALPAYMMPSAFVVLDAFPLTANGKVDRKALPAPELEVSGEYVAPRDALEAALAQIFCEVLRLERVGVHDDFFALGGHSLRATQVVARARVMLSVDLPVRVLFEAPTVARLAVRVRAASGAGDSEAIARVDRSGPLPASFAQTRLWFLDQMDPGTATYNVPMLLRLEGKLDPRVLEHALRELVARHEALRTTFVAIDGQPHQVIHPSVELPLRRVDAMTDDEARTLIAREVHTPFDLARGPVVRTTLFRVAPEAHVLVLCIHHVATDGWATEILARELMSIYGAFAAGQPSPLEPLSVDYADFSAWQRSWLTGDALAKQLAFWKEHLSGAPAALELPTDRARPPTKQYRGGNVHFTVPRALADRVYAMCRREGATPFMVLLAAYQSLLSRWSGQKDIVVGTPIANRTRQELEGIVGFFINTLALRASLEDSPSFTALVRQVKRTALTAFSHQDVPFEKLVDELHVARDTSRGPIFQALFLLQNVTFEKLSIGDVTVTRVPPSFEISKFDLTLGFVEQDGGFWGELKYDVALFDHATIERFSSHFLVLLEAALSEPDASVARLPLMGDGERQRVLGDWNATTRPSSARRTVHGWFEAQVDRTPSAVAVECSGTRLSYAELDGRANRIANALLARGVAREERVAVEMDRSIDMLAAMLGVMKAGGAYLPIDPQLPEDRRAFMKADGGVTTTLDQGAVSHALASESAERANVHVGAGHLAYVLYTSGSTGRPKGTMVSHANVTNLLASMVRVPGISADDTTLSLTTISFDVSVAELFLPLVAGAKVVIGSREEARDPRLIAALIDATGARQFGATPATWRMMVDSGWRPRAGMEIHCAGEALPRDLADALLENGASLWNLYGPTEATVYASGIEIRRGERISIGRPLDNTQLYILDPDLQPVPTGVLGELYIAGAGVARGYLGRPELTAEKFVPDPFAPAPGARMYRTGDVVRWLADGTIDYLGRIDHQVKLRGFRIELGEIEAALSAIPAVERSVVLAREDIPGDKLLVAYVVAAAGTTLETDALESALALTLPAYMIPGAFVVLETFPLNSNGKVDRKLLPAPQLTAAASEYVAPRDASEEAIAEIFRAVLHAERVGIHDDFFAIGGHSLRATQVISRIRAQLGVELPVRTLFEAPTVALLAARVRGAEAAAAHTAIARVDRHKPLPASFAQARLWFLDQLDPGAATYNVPMLLRLEGPLDVAALERAIQELVLRHEALRTTFVAIDGMPHQVIPLAVDLALGREDASSEEDAQARIATAIHLPFDLARGPLVRATLVRIAPKTHMLVVTVHHVATDGWATEILAKELSTLYGAFAAGRPSPLPPTTIDYADFAAWQRAWLTDAVLAKQLAYWKKHLAGAPAALELPVDHPRPPMKQYRGGGVELSVPRTLAERVHVMCRREGATPFMVLLAAYQALLSRWSGQKDIVVGTPIANRTRDELESVVGFFVNTLALRTSFDDSPSFEQLVRQVKRAALAAYEHQDIPFEKLVDELRVPRDTSRGPVFQAMFLMQNMTRAELSFGDVTATRLHPGSEVAKFDLTLGFHEEDGGFRGELRYDVALFDPATIERFAGHFLVFLEGALGSPDTSVAKLPLMGEAERRSVLGEWNDTSRILPDPRPLHEVFEAQAASTPDAVALELEGAPLSYRALDERANDLAHRLREHGVGRESIVAVSMTRSFEMVIALYAVLKAGGAYAPLDPLLPPARLAFMVQDLGARVVLVARGTAPGFDTGESAVLEVDAAARVTRPSKPVTPIDDRQLAYVIYTSGSTGMPKAAANTHAGLRNRIQWMQSAYPLDAHDRVLQKTPYSFDVSVWEFFWPLAFGARLVIARPEGHKDPLYLTELIRSAGITTLHFVPSMLQAFLEEPSASSCTSLDRVICSGEALPRSLAQRFFTRFDCELHNLYGPTEASIDVSYWQCRRDDAREVPIGRPIWNIQLYVVDEQMQPTPIGVAGELCIAGIGLARGYVGRPELTADRFVPCPFGATPGARMYRTGDLARWLPTGEVDYLGRLDHQVKVRGYRIELGEIEALLAASAGVAASVVLAREDTPGDKRLVGYVSAASGATLDAGVLRAELARALPEYMVPSAFVVLEAMPLSANGKIDRKALPAPKFAASESAYVAARTPTEHVLVEIFCEVVRLDRVGIHDDFFALGGHSLLATRVMTRIRDRLGVNVPVRAIFEAPTVARLGERVDRIKSDDNGARLERVADRKRAPLSYNQRFWWRRQQSSPDSPGYKYIQAFRIRGVLDEALLGRSVDEETRRHDALRTTFEVEGDEPVQVVHEPREGCLARVDLTGATPEKVMEWMRAENDRHPDLRAGAPFPHLTLLHLASDDHILVITGHRIAFDPMLCANLVANVLAIYGAFAENAPSPLVDPAFQYVDFVAWQRKAVETPELKKRLAEARTRLAGATALALPVDREQPGTYTTATHPTPMVMDEPVWDAIRDLARAESTSQFVVLSALFKSFLSTLTGQLDVTIVAPNELSRGLDPSLSSVFGCFHDYFILRTDLSGTPSLREVIRREGVTVLASQRDLDIPCSLVTDAYVDNPLWRVALNVVPAGSNGGASAAMPAGLTVRAEVAPRHRMVDLAWGVLGKTGGLWLAADLFDKATAQRLAADFSTFLVRALAAPDTAITRL